MLAGVKPLSLFYDDAAVLAKESTIPYDAFAPYVDCGMFVKDEFECKLRIHQKNRKEIGIKYVLYSLKNQEWRIGIMKAVVFAMLDENFDRDVIDKITGMLLGYDDKDIAKYIASRIR